MSPSRGLVRLTTLLIMSAPLAGCPAMEEGFDFVSPEGGDAGEQAQAGGGEVSTSGGRQGGAATGGEARPILMDDLYLDSKGSPYFRHNMEG